MSDELIGCFSSALFVEWCREKFDHFAADLHAVKDAGGFAEAEIVGYVRTLPEDSANRPLLVMAIRVAEQVNAHVEIAILACQARGVGVALQHMPPFGEVRLQRLGENALKIYRRSGGSERPGSHARPIVDPAAVRSGDRHRGTAAWRPADRA